ncbi:nucleotidyl transferase AbiEii/AbiGii toxin family protein [Micromonospora yasonensis]|uniref:nucleotidyl transferase AbiEii/AbiGii toxin family protein n=1 Tax=Micromonospora yasonensis TaxID=1128667 RepID=UPI002232B455|nr:nucleotidyl transferase AbiEii/AbiGii toxin family protein [Micromonospora yasonensis]MCW3841687.1 nucleotidyl transferase AbiEii/AbiGii toxin family protein [Micromonospora yasonensis]
MSGSTFRHETPSAFRTALKERFGQIARADRRYRLDELQRQFAYDRALARLFRSDDADRWVLKGAGALLARLATARHSKDVDVFFNATDADVDDAVDALRAALRIDLGDHFAFDVMRVAPLQEEAKGARVYVNARLGPTSFASFHIDVVVGTVMTGTPDVVAPLTPLNIEGLVRPNYRVFPIADHLADKLCATIGTYTRDGQPASSSRVKDLVDIAIIAITQPSAPIRCAALSPATRRCARSSFPNDSSCPTPSAGPYAMRESRQRHPAPYRTTTPPSASRARFSIPCSMEQRPASGTPRREPGSCSDLTVGSSTAAGASRARLPLNSDGSAWMPCGVKVMCHAAARLHLCRARRP